KPSYHLSEFIIVLEEKANKSNKYCVCKECISGSSYAETEKNKFANIQELVHLANNSEQENFNDNSEASSSKNLSEASSSKNSTASIRKNTLDHYCFWPLNEEQQKHFEQLILKATVENPEIKMLFEFVHPLIKLPLRKNLSGQILSESTQKITKSIKEIAQNDKDRITLVYDDWKNIKKESIFGSILVTSMGRVLVWNAEDIANEHTKWFDVQHRTENMLSDLKKEKIKVNAVVMDCAPEYEAASHYLCFANIIKSRAAFKNLATKIEEGNDDSLKDFSKSILSNISNSEWWKNLMQLKVLLEPYMAFLNKLQHDKGHLTEHKKVLTMCQLRSELLHSRNILAIDKLLKTYKQKISISSENNEQISLDDNEEKLYTSEDDNDINMRQSQINVEQPEIKVIVEWWVNLAKENDGDYMFSLNELEGLTNLYDNDPIFQDDIYPDIHPANNLVAK
ncbi:2419_t:CDS:2, partial [Cetraspora pellucida]